MLPILANLLGGWPALPALEVVLLTFLANGPRKPRLFKFVPYFSVTDDRLRFSIASFGGYDFCDRVPEQYETCSLHPSRTDVALAVGYEGDNFAYTLSMIPEPASWSMMIAGFGLIGSVLRGRRRLDTVAS